MAMSPHLQQMVLALSVGISHALAFVFLRLYAKHRRSRPFHRDDYTLLAAIASLSVSFALTMAATAYGYGQHYYEHIARPVEVAHLVAAAEFFALMAVALSKTSVAFTLLELARGAWMRRLIQGLALSVLFFVTWSALYLWIAIWDSLLVEACKTGSHVWYLAVVAAAWSAATDFIFAGLPWFIIWDLQMRKSEKIGLGLVMSLGIVSGIVASIKISHISCKDFKQDITYTSVPLVVWTFAEPSVIIMAASAPYFRLLFRGGDQATGRTTNVRGRIPRPMDLEHSDGRCHRMHTIRISRNPGGSSGGLYQLGNITIRTTVEQDVADANAMPGPRGREDEETLVGDSIPETGVGEDRRRETTYAERRSI
ncbi:hypothetical protein VTK26DRAFT_5658 [Humicola hyalothermophila]